MKDLFSPFEIGDLKLKNRIIMAPMTRSRAVDDQQPNFLMATYYSQRASAGLIITEATQVAPMGVGYPNTPGIYTKEHADGWKHITDAVHHNGGVIFSQLWHVGRVSHSLFLNGQTPIAPSPVRINGKHFTLKGMKDFEIPRELSVEEIKAVVREFERGARFAKDAGFDGIEVHGANGYLIDQFIKDGTNKRTDIYGGSIENRSRFLFEILDAVTKVFPSNRIGIRLSPSGTFNDMTNSNSYEDYRYISNRLNDYDLAYLHIINGNEADVKHGGDILDSKHIRDVYKGHLILNGGYDKERGTNALKEDEADAIAYGKPFISNPDLVRRFKDNLALTQADEKTFYSSGPEGYVDYYTFEELEEKVA